MKGVSTKRNNARMKNSIDCFIVTLYNFYSCCARQTYLLLLDLLDNSWMLDFGYLNLLNCFLGLLFVGIALYFFLLLMLLR